MPQETPHYVYILRCSDGSYYVGSSSDLAERVEAHKSGEAAAWTARRRPLTLVYKENCPDAMSAVQREKQIKGWTRAKKEALIRGNKVLLKKLSKRNKGKALCTRRSKNTRAGEQ